MTELGHGLKRAAIKRDMAANLKERRRLETKTKANRVTLGELIRGGQKAGIPVAELARMADIGRERAYELLRGLEREPTGAGRPKGSR